MKQDELNKEVTEELKHIPRIKGALEQNLFRSRYNAMRRHDIATNPAISASESFRRALEQARLSNPNFSPIYNREFFRI